MNQNFGNLESLGENPSIGLQDIPKEYDPASEAQRETLAYSLIESIRNKLLHDPESISPE